MLHDARKGETGIDSLWIALQEWNYCGLDCGKLLSALEHTLANKHFDDLGPKHSQTEEEEEEEGEGDRVGEEEENSSPMEHTDTKSTVT